jgi:hypothetical protein
MKCTHVFLQNTQPNIFFFLIIQSLKHTSLFGGTYWISKKEAQAYLLVNPKFAMCAKLKKRKELCSTEKKGSSRPVSLINTFILLFD